MSDRFELAADGTNRRDVDADWVFGIMADGVELVAEREPEGRGVLLILILQKLPSLGTRGYIRNDTAVLTRNENEDAASHGTITRPPRRSRQGSHTYHRV